MKLSNPLKAHITSSVNGNKNYYWDSPEFKPLTWTSLEISQERKANSKYAYRIKINGKVSHEIENTDAREFSPVKVYAGDNFFVTSKIKLKNIKVQTWPDSVPPPTATTTTTKPAIPISGFFSLFFTQ